MKILFVEHSEKVINNIGRLNELTSWYMDNQLWGLQFSTIKIAREHSESLKSSLKTNASDKYADRS